MASLREIKDHISSVRSTLKITSAMKLVASAKLRKAQQAAEGIRPYTEALSEMLSAVMGNGTGSPLLRPSANADPSPQSWAPPVTATGGYDCARNSRPVAIVAVASNSSLCGAFNINVIHKVQELISEYRAAGVDVEVLSVGRKMAEAMRKAGYPSPSDYSDLVGHSSFEKSAAFAQELIDGFNTGRWSSVVLIYNHFVSTASQKVQVETYLTEGEDNCDAWKASPSGGVPPAASLAGGAHPQDGRDDGKAVTGSEGMAFHASDDYILEPSREEILETLLPQVMRLRIHTVLLDSIAAEHAARTIAMQTASDNAEDLLSELTLEYNKGRQQKITSEILDLVGGAQQ